MTTRSAAASHGQLSMGGFDRGQGSDRRPACAFSNSGASRVSTTRPAGRQQLVRLRRREAPTAALVRSDVRRVVCQRASWSPLHVRQQFINEPMIRAVTVPELSKYSSFMNCLRRHSQGVGFNRIGGMLQPATIILSFSCRKACTCCACACWARGAAWLERDRARLLTSMSSSPCGDPRRGRVKSVAPVSASSRGVRDPPLPDHGELLHPTATRSRRGMAKVAGFSRPSLRSRRSRWRPLYQADIRHLLGCGAIPRDARHDGSRCAQ